MKVPVLLLLCVLFFPAQLLAEEYNKPITNVEYHYVVFESDGCSWCTLLKRELHNNAFEMYADQKLDKVWILNVKNQKNKELQNVYKIPNFFPGSAVVVSYNSVQGKEVKVIDRASGFMPYQKIINFIDNAKNRFISKIAPRH